MRKGIIRAIALPLLAALAFTLLSGCGARPQTNTPVITSPLSDVSVDMNSAAYWISKMKDPDKILLSKPEIHQLNVQTSTSGIGVYDLVSYPSGLTDRELTAFLNEHKLPEVSLYAADGTALYEVLEPELDEEGEEIVTDEEGSSYLTAIRDNLNIASLLPNNGTSYALTLHNIEFRRFPTSDDAYAEPGNLEENLFIEGRLSIGEPVVVLHTSRDQVWYYVQTRNDRGWVNWSDLVFMEKGAWVSYIESVNFVIITAPSVTVMVDVGKPMTLYMGTVLPLFQDIVTSVNGQGIAGCYVVRIPTKDRFGNLEFSPLLIPMTDSVSLGYMEYTPGNVLRQAFRLLGQRIDPHSTNGGWDADNFFTAVYSVFGIHLPSTFERQKAMKSNQGDLSGMTSAERKTALGKLTPGTLLYSLNSAFIYLGTNDGTPYVLHAAKDFYMGEARYTMNSILVTSTSIVRADGMAYIDAFAFSRTLSVVKEK